MNLEEIDTGPPNLFPLAVALLIAGGAMLGLLAGLWLGER